jgi:CheY-like chemotaxis protein
MHDGHSRPRGAPSRYAIAGKGPGLARHCRHAAPEEEQAIMHTVATPSVEAFRARPRRRQGHDTRRLTATGPHILVIDANLGNLATIGRALSGHGYAITLSATLPDAGTVLALAPDLIVVDPRTPPATGRTPGATLAAGLARIPVLCHTSSDEAAHWVGVAAMPVLPKPATTSDLLGAIATLVASSVSPPPGTGSTRHLPAPRC